MTRLEKCELLKSKGYTYDPITGKIFGIRGKEIKRKCFYGYINLNDGVIGSLKGHHFAWYMTYNNVEFIELDHINQNKTDNRICNLRISNRSQQNQNTNAKGYTFYKPNGKWQAQIYHNAKQIYLGRFNTEDEARQAYLIAKEKYHII
jgi:hypothetical protein